MGQSFILHNIEDVPGCQEIIPGVYLGGRGLTNILQQRGMQEQDHVAFLRGCAGWAPRQLDGEIRNGMWEVIGHASSERVWLELNS